MLTQDHMQLYQLMIKIFDLIHKFRYTQDVLYTSAIEEFHRRLNAEEDDDQFQQIPRISPEARNQLQLLGEEYRKVFDNFYEELIEIFIIKS
jgi:hypothetical protein